MESVILVTLKTRHVVLYTVNLVYISEKSHHQLLCLFAQYHFLTPNTDQCERLPEICVPAPPGLLIVGFFSGMRWSNSQGPRSWYSSFKQCSFECWVPVCKPLHSFLNSWNILVLSFTVCGWHGIHSIQCYSTPKSARPNDVWPKWTTFPSSSTPSLV